MTDLKRDELTTYNVGFQDKFGDPDARVDGAPTWSASPDGVLTLAPSSDGMSCDVAAAGEGSAVLTVTADADLGEGVTNISASDPINVIAADAAGVTLAHGEIRKQAA